MDAALSIALGYFVGSLSPSSLVGRVKKTDVRKSGTGNLGATNTMLVLGWGAGIFVMLFDLMKSFLSGKLAQYLFPGLSTAGMLACIGAMIGHCFPVFHRFRGGKGLATFGGLVIYCGFKVRAHRAVRRMGGHVDFRLHCDVPHNGGHRPAPADVSFRRSAGENYHGHLRRSGAGRHAHQQYEKGPRRGRDHARPGLFQGETAQRTLKSFRPKK